MNKKIYICCSVLFIICVIIFLIFFIKANSEVKDEEIIMINDKNVISDNIVTDEIDELNFKYNLAYSISKDENIINVESEEINKIIDSNLPIKYGVWIPEQDRNEIENYIQNQISSDFEINQNGYMTFNGNIDTKTDELIQSMYNLTSNDKYEIILSLSYSYIDKTELDNFTEISDSYKIFKNGEKILVMFYRNDFPNKTALVEINERITGKALDNYKK